MKQSVPLGSLYSLLILFWFLMEASTYILSPYSWGGDFRLTADPAAILAAVGGNLFTFSSAAMLPACVHRSLKPGAGGFTLFPPLPTVLRL